MASNTWKPLAPSQATCGLWSEPSIASDMFQWLTPVVPHPTPSCSGLAGRLWAHWCTLQFGSTGPQLHNLNSLDFSSPSCRMWCVGWGIQVETQWVILKLCSKGTSLGSLLECHKIKVMTVSRHLERATLLYYLNKQKIYHCGSEALRILTLNNVKII